MRGNNTFVALWEQNDDFQSNCGIVVGAVMLEVKWLPVV